MGIKFRCHACDKKLHVKSFLAGKRGICPECGARVRIPHESGDSALQTSSAPQTEDSSVSQMAPSAADSDDEQQAVATAVRPRTVPRAVQAAESRPDPITESPDAVWYVRPPSGGQFGPANGDIMRRWLEEGRVSPTSLVWREGWEDWKEAGPIFPELQPDLAQPNPVDFEDLFDAMPIPQVRMAAAETDLGASTLAAAPASRRKSNSGLWVVITLSVACVGLIVALLVVLMQQSSG